MVLHTSALVALLLGEAETKSMVEAIARAGTRIVGTPTLVEAAAVMQAKKGPGGEVALDALLERMDVRIVEMSVPAAKLARLAYSRYGKGVGTPPVLNFGNFLAYGVAMAEGEPLLFKGNDFTQTGVPAVPY